MRFHSLAVLVASAAVMAALVSAPADAETAGGTSPTGSSAAAARALAHAEAVIAPEGSLTPTREAGMVLHRLSVLRDDLVGADRDAADRLLARPTDGDADPDGSGYQHPEDALRACNSLLCVHWVESTTDKVSTRDDDDSGIPDYVETVAATVGDVLDTYAGAGYRAPQPDGNLGGDDRMDIYLSNIGVIGYYGYCNSDEDVRTNGPHDTWAYCVLDNNYSRDEFPTNTPRENLEVTAAHELFHAVQFAYDYFEDGWFMEATATWAEDELYDDVDDNVQYLRQSPLSQPGASMDHFAGLRQYGDWIFFRFLTEKYPDAEGAMPTLVRDLWERADSATGGADDYSMQAVATVLTALGTSLGEEFGDFAGANRRPGASYEEGSANHYPAAPLAGKATLTGGQRSSGVLTRKVDHLASATIRFTRGPGLSASALRVQVDLPPTSRGTSARVTVVGTSGSPVISPLDLSSQGDASVSVDFTGGVKYVEVTLVNASIRYACDLGTSYSCQGRSRDDNLRMQVRATAIS